MQKPAMILFDYGQTLIYESEFDFLKGIQALFPYVSKNPLGITPKTWNDFGAQLYKEVFDIMRGAGVEMHEYQVLRFEMEYFGIELTIPIQEAELILWDNISDGGQMPFAGQMLEALQQKAIRSGVISNLIWSENALKHRINRLLPGNHFEFILTSSENMFRKPNKYIFELAIRKAGLSPEQIWFCGDNLEADVIGAHMAGIFPVWYNPQKKRLNQNLDFPFLEIQDWRELALHLAES